MEEKTWINAELTGSLLLDAALSLLKSGASSDRIRTNIQRLATPSGLTPNISIMPLSISISLHHDGSQIRYSGTGSIPAQGVNFEVVSGISQLSWKVHENTCSIGEAVAELARLQALPHYNRWLLLVMVGLAGAAFCYTFGGSIPEMCIGFTATVCGLFCKQQMLRKAYNPYIITFMSAVIAGSVVGMLHLTLPELVLEHAFSTCVLFLIPGVPLINSVTDLIEGYTLNGVARGVGALIHALSIAFGLVVVLYIFGII